MQKRELTPLSGALFVVLLIVAFVVLSGETPEPDASAGKVVSYYTEHDTTQIVAAAVVALSTVPLLMFAATLRERAGAALPDRSPLPGFAFGAGVVAATGFLVAAAIHFVLADLADEIRPGAAQALNAVDGSMFIPFGVGLVTLVLASSVIALRSDLLPRWLGRVGVVLFVVFWTPVGFLAFGLSGIWILVASIVLYRRGEPVRSELGAHRAASARPAEVSMQS